MINSILKRRFEMTNGSRPTSPRPLRVFLSYASEDKPTVLDLYNRLQACNIDPWFDDKELVGGMNWEDEIRREVRRVDAVIVCLSLDAIQKVGFFHTELMLALEEADKRPEGSIFIIPLLLEKCDLPESLIRRRLHRVDYFKEDGFDRLIRALKECVQKLSDSFHIEIASINCEAPRREPTPNRSQAPMISPIDSPPISAAPTSQGITPQHGGPRGDRVKRLVTIAIALALIGGIAALFWSQVIKLPYDAPSPKVTSTPSPAQSGAAITFDALGSGSNVIEVYPGVGNTPQDKTYDGTYYSGETVPIVCETKGRTVTSNPTVGEQYRRSDEWYKLQTPPGNQPEYATAVYADEHGSVPQC